MRGYVTRRTFIASIGVTAVASSGGTALFLDKGGVELAEGDLEKVETDGNEVTVYFVDNHEVQGVGLIEPNGNERVPASFMGVGSGQSKQTLDAGIDRRNERDDGWKVVAYGKGYDNPKEDAEITDSIEFEFEDEYEDPMEVVN